MISSIGNSFIVKYSFKTKCLQYHCKTVVDKGVDFPINISFIKIIINISI